MFAITRFESWGELKDAYATRSLWAFRGQSSADWPLETTLHREAVRNEGLGQNNLLSREDWIVYQFKRFAHHHRADLPTDDDMLGWLALIQHYGGPTRLLDFSYSLYVAAFFAIESAIGDAAIWAINSDTVEIATYNRLDYWPCGSISDIREANNIKFHELIDTPTRTRAVIHVEPKRVHERIWLQKGFFLAPTDPNATFMENLAGAFEKKISSLEKVKERKWSANLNERSWREYSDRRYIAIVKIVIPKSWHREILDDLHNMNISAATLFPGLEGFARSLKYFV